MEKTVGHGPCEDRETQSQTRKNSIGLDEDVGEIGSLYYNCAIRLICMVWIRACNSASAGLAPLVCVSVSSRPTAIYCGDYWAHSDYKPI